MDRTVQNIRELYNNSQVNEQRYILSLAMLGDVKPHTMQDLSRRFQKARQGNPRTLSHGFQDMELEDQQGVRSDTKQALHQIKREGKGLGKSLTIDSALASHFADLGHSGMLTRALETKGIESATDRASQYDESPRMQKASADDEKNDDNSDDDSSDETMSRERAPRASSNDGNDESARNRRDMNRTNRLRHTEEQDETESKLARVNKEKRGQMQKQMKGPHQDL